MNNKVGKIIIRRNVASSSSVSVDTKDKGKSYKRIVKTKLEKSTTDLECSICYESCGKRSAILCPSCESIICQNCLLQHININKVFPACTNGECSFQFDEIVLRKVLPAKSVTQIRKFVKLVLLDRERSKFPTDMVEINRDLEKGQLIKKKSEIINQIRNIKEQLSTSFDAILYNEKKRLKQAEILISLEIRNSQRNDPSYFDFLRKSEQDIINNKKTNNKLIPCGYGGCKGFLSQYSSESLTDINPTMGLLKYLSCLICNKKKCDKCHEFLNDNNHICNPDNIASVQLYMENTKPCPGCGERIERAYGCDHMWCTICHTSFDYTTGKRIQDSSHRNPHFTEWKMGNRDKTILNQSVHVKVVDINDLIDKMLELGLGRNEMYLLLSFRNLIQPGKMIFNFKYIEESNSDYRKDFLKGKITEEQLTNRVFLKYRKKERSLHNIQIINILWLEGNQFMWEVLNAQQVLDIVPIIDSMRVLIEYVNTLFKDVNTGLDYKTYPFINNDFHRIDQGKPVSLSKIEKTQRFFSDMINRRIKYRIERGLKTINERNIIEDNIEVQNVLCDSYIPCGEHCIIAINACYCPCHFVII